MTTYSYSTYQGPAEPAPEASTGVRLDADAGMTSRVVIRDGVAHAENSSVNSVSAAELNPHFNDGTVFASAKSMHSLGLQQITPDTLITIDGVQASVKAFEAMGLVHRGTDGSYAEGSGRPQEAPPEAPPVDAQDFPGMPTETVAQIDQALEGVADEYLDPLIASGVSIATGEIDRSTIIRQMTSYAGVTPEQAEVRVATMEAAYQAQADTVLAGYGLGQADLGDFYAYCKENHKGALRDAVTKQVRENSVAGYRALADKYHRANPPSLNAVKAAGLQTRQHGDLPEVLMDGRWMTIATAARLGMI